MSHEDAPICAIVEQAQAAAVTAARARDLALKAQEDACARCVTESRRD